MQTFLPYSNFAASAEVLDRRRLGKQRVETLQIMTALLEGRGWVNHPATRMWRGFEFCLLMYQEAICEEWMTRGYSDSCLVRTGRLYFKHRWGGDPDVPDWLGDPSVHISHQSNLLRKDYAHYGPYFPGVPTDLEYVWPA